MTANPEVSAAPRTTSPSSGKSPPDLAEGFLRILVEKAPGFLSSGADTARAGLKYTLAPAIIMELVGAAMIGWILWVDAADGGATWTTGKFVTGIVTGALLLLAAPVALYFNGVRPGETDSKETIAIVNEMNALIRRQGDG